MNIYQDIILDHYQHPRNCGTLDGANTTTLENPSCGDSITLSVRLQDGKIADIAFTGKGCAISQASASLLTEYVKGKSAEDATKMDKDILLRLLGVELSPGRLKCALLPLETLKKLIANFSSNKQQATRDK